MKKVLIITYYWPPAGGPGVQRWLKFVKYLEDFEIKPVVYIPENPDYPLIDPSLEDEVPAGVTIIRKKILEPYFLARFFSGKNTSTLSSGIIAEEKQQTLLQRIFLYIRGNFFIPDARKFWVKPSVNFLKQYIRENRIDTIITTGPPHSMHLIGLGLKEKVPVKWFADFRDPWTQIGYHNKLKLSKRSRVQHEILEKKVLNSADHIITTSFTTCEEFSGKTSKPVTVITNGYEEENIFNDPDRYFSIAHIGSLLSGRNPENLWKVLGELVKEDPGFKKDFLLKLIGAVSGKVLNSVKEHIPEENVDTSGYVDHQEALLQQRSARVLLLVEIDSHETKGIIPGKFFEYMAAKRPILALGPKGWDVEKILKEKNAGDFFSYEEHQSLKQKILQYYDLFKNNTLEQDSQGIEQFSRRNLTAQLAKLLKE